MVLNKKHYNNILVMPYMLKGLFDHIEGDRTFTKKKDSENYVFFKACEKLYQLGYLNDNLYPKVDHLVKYVVPPQQ